MRRVGILILLVAALLRSPAKGQQTGTYSRAAAILLAPSLIDTNSTFLEYLAGEAHVPSSHVIRERAAVRMGMTSRDIHSSGYSVATRSDVESSNVIITVTGPSPALAAAYANALAEEFIEWKQQVRMDYLESLSSNLVPLISRYEHDLKAAEEKSSAYERDRGADDPRTLSARREAQRAASLLELATDRLAGETARIQGAASGAVIVERAQP